MSTHKAYALARQFADDIRKEFEDVGYISVMARPSGTMELSIYDCSSYAEGVRIAKRLGAEIKSKQVHDPHQPWSALMCKVNGDDLTIYCKSLPPTCEIVTKTERVPKMETKDTGDFIEITRQEFRCLNAEEDA